MAVRISIITPTFNSEKTISRNVKSIAVQTYKNFEHIIIDQNSTDDTIKIIKDIYRASGISNRLKIISETDEGIADAMNKGIKAASGDIINILGSDDCYTDEKVLWRVKESFSRNPEAVFVFGNIRFTDSKYGSINKLPLNKTVIKGLPFFQQALYLKKNLFEKTGFFNTGYKIAMDFDFYCRLEKTLSTKFNNQIYIPVELAEVHYGGISSTQPIEGLKEVERALKENELWCLRARLMLYENYLKTYLKDLFLLFQMKSVLRALRSLEWNFIKPLKKRFEKL
jgi:glycosyltransferase involved in cell wall biosynthesis